MQSEGELQTQILEYLKFSKLVSWRQYVGGISQYGGRVRNPMAGFPDICGLTQLGRFWGIEIKKPKGGKVSTKQIDWHAKLRSSQALIFVVTSFDQFLDIIKNLETL